MRRGLRQRLFQRRKPALPPLYLRTSWPDFLDRMHKAIAIDMQILLGEVSRADLLRQQETKPLPAIHDAPTLAEVQWWEYTDKTVRVVCSGIDQHATQPMLAEV